MSAAKENPNALPLSEGGWEIKINKKAFFQDIVTGLTQLKLGSFSSATKQGIAALFKLLPEDNTPKRAFHLIFTAIHNACLAILQEHGIEGTRFDLNTQAQNVELESKKGLEESEYLIFIAEKQSAESTWCKDELEYWCGELNRKNQLIILNVKDKISFNVIEKILTGSKLMLYQIY